MKALKLQGEIYEVVKVVCGRAFTDLRYILTPKRLKGQYLTDDRLWAIVEEQCAELSAEIWSEIARNDRREYDARRDTRPRGASSHKGVNSKSGRKINARPRTGGHFVAIDSEGTELAQTQVGSGRKKATFIDQRTCLWMAGGAEGFDNRLLVNLDGCSSKQIFEFLLSLPPQ